MVLLSDRIDMDTYKLFLQPLINVITTKASKEPKSIHIYDMIWEDVRVATRAATTASIIDSIKG